MSKIVKIVSCGVAVLALLVLTAIVAYEFGERRTADLILHSDFSDQDDSVSTTNTDDTVEMFRAKLNRLTNDYDSACYRYQELYEAYDALYAQVGASSGHEKIVRPDGARGNEVSCYR